MPTLYSVANETGNRNRILEMCKFRIWLQLIITSTILYRFSPNFACGSQMWPRRRLLFARQTGSSLPILEVCGFRFWQFSGSGDHICELISTKSHVQIKFGNADFVFNGEWNYETRNRNQILEMCKFRFWLVHWIDPRLTEHSYACYFNYYYNYHVIMIMLAQIIVTLSQNAAATVYKKQSLQQ